MLTASLLGISGTVTSASATAAQSGAVTYRNVTGSGKSYDSGASYSIKITFYSDGTSYWDVTAKDISPDGQGPIVYVGPYYVGAPMDVETYIHVLGGYNKTGSAQNYHNDYHGRFLAVRICNGGSRAEPNNCRTDHYDG